MLIRRFLVGKHVLNLVLLVKQCCLILFRLSECVIKHIICINGFFMPFTTFPALLHISCVSGIIRKISRLTENQYDSRTGVAEWGWQIWVGIGLHFLWVGNTSFHSTVRLLASVEVLLTNFKIGYKQKTNIKQTDSGIYRFSPQLKTRLERLNQFQF